MRRLVWLPRVEARGWWERAAFEALVPAAVFTAWRFNVIDCQWLLLCISYNFQRWMSRLEQR